MKLYVIGRLNDTNVAIVMRDLKEQGHEITFDWSASETSSDPRRPYLGHREFWQDVALIETEAIDAAEAVVLVDGPNLKGAMFELGWALAGGKPAHVWMEPERPMTDSLFFTMPNVHVYPVVFDLYAALDAGP